MIELTRATRWDLPALYLLYLHAFPASERKPFSIIRRMAREGRTDLWTIRKDGRLAGLAATVNSPDIVLLDYFAIRKKLRGQGVGSEALRAFLRMYEGRGVMVEIESTRIAAPNQPERERRRRFYESCGMELMGFEADLFGIRMELLGLGCRLDFEGYRNFYQEYYHPRAAERVRPIEEA